MIAYRLCGARHAAAALDGEGARLYGGRWNPKGVRMVYAASSLALGALETFVHFSSMLLPANYVSIAVDIPDALAVEMWTIADLPAEWAETPAPSVLHAMGKDWVTQERTPVLVVPSAVIALESIILINPAHPDAARITTRAPQPFVFDPRLIKKRSHASQRRRKPARRP